MTLEHMIGARLGRPSFAAFGKHVNENDATNPHD